MSGRIAAGHGLITTMIPVRSLRGAPHWL